MSLAIPLHFKNSLEPSIAISVRPLWLCNLTTSETLINTVTVLIFHFAFKLFSDSIIPNTTLGQLALIVYL